MLRQVSVDRSQAVHFLLVRILSLDLGLVFARIRIKHKRRKIAADPERILHKIVGTVLWSIRTSGFRLGDLISIQAGVMSLSGSDLPCMNQTTEISGILGFGQI